MKFKAVSMPCTEAQFKSMEKELVELGCEIVFITNFEIFNYITNNSLGCRYITNYTKSQLKDEYGELFPEFNKELFLQCCGKEEPQTPFKVGDEVYDSFYHPNLKGQIVKIVMPQNWLEVKFGEIKEYYNTRGQLPTHYEKTTLSFTPYEVIYKGFTQTRPPKVCIKGDGTKEYGKKIIEYLEGLGGKNGPFEFKAYGNNYYHIKENGSISFENQIPEGYTEISLKSESLEDRVARLENEIKQLKSK